MENLAFGAAAVVRVGVGDGADVGGIGFDLFF